MSRSKTILAVIAALCLTPAAGMAGSWTIRLGGGVAIPTGNYGSTDSSGLAAKTGPQAGIDITYQVSDRLAFGVDGAWVRNTHRNEGQVVEIAPGSTFTDNLDKFRIWRAGAHVRFLIPTENEMVRPYGVFGLGVYHMIHDYRYTLQGGGDTFVFTDEIDHAAQPGSRLGGRFGLGATFRPGERLGFDLEADFNFVSLDRNTFGISSATYAGIQAGVTYRLGSK